MRSVLIYTALAFTASWLLWWLASTTSPGLPILFLAGTVMPAIAAVLVTRMESHEALVALLRQTTIWRVRWRWYVIAVTFFAAAKLSAATGIRFATGAWPAFGETNVLVMAAGTLFSTPVQLGEELGWRGLMLPRLADRVGLRAASLLVGVSWAAWHLPMFYLPGGDMLRQSFPVFVVAVTSLSVAMTWVYAHTGGSLLLTMLMHAAINNTAGILPAGNEAHVDNIWLFHTSVAGWATLSILGAVAICLLWAMPARTDPIQAARSAHP